MISNFSDYKPWGKFGKDWLSSVECSIRYWSLYVQSVVYSFCDPVIPFLQGTSTASPLLHLPMLPFWLMFLPPQAKHMCKIRKIVINMHAFSFKIVWEGWKKKQECPVGTFNCQCAIKISLQLSETLFYGVFTWIFLLNVYDIIF